MLDWHPRLAFHPSSLVTIFCRFPIFHISLVTLQEYSDTALSSVAPSHVNTLSSLSPFVMNIAGVIRIDNLHYIMT